MTATDPRPNSATESPPLTCASSLRPYQREAIERLYAALGRGARRVLLALPTGGGKTVIASDIVRTAVESGQSVLFIAHRRELIHQAYEKFRAHGLRDTELGVIMAQDKRRRPTAPVQIASIDTLRHRVKPAADIVFIDECHRALAKSYVDCASEYPKAVHLGLTATPYRADGGGLGNAYDELLVIASPRQLMDLGYLVEPRVFTSPSRSMPDLSKVRVKNGDYDEAALARVMDTHALVGDIVEHWKKLAGGERTVAFAVSVAHSQHIAERFRAAGIAAEHVDGTTPIGDRAATIERWEAGVTRVVSNCGVFCEGFDLPAVKCAILARPTKSLGLYLQQAGRILRPWNGVGAVILDHAGCALTHGLPQDGRTFVLDTAKPAAPAGPAPTRVCPECYTVLPSGTRLCPHCQWEFPVADTVLPENSGELVELRAEVRSSAREAEMRAVWDELCATVLERRYKPGWAYHQFKDRCLQNPPSHFPRPPVLPEHEPAGRERVLRDLTQAVEDGTETLAWAKTTFLVRFGTKPPPGVLEEAALRAYARRSHAERRSA